MMENDKEIHSDWNPNDRVWNNILKQVNTTGAAVVETVDFIYNPSSKTDFQSGIINGSQPNYSNDWAV